MILEVAVLNVRPGSAEKFESVFREASAIIASMPGHLSHEIRRCIEASSRYLLLVHWRELEDHTVGFRQSADYQRWRALLHHFYDPFPTVEHYGEPLDLRPGSSRHPVPPSDAI
jgi:heme-degrading monooxygenase HmoA